MAASKCFEFEITLLSITTLIVSIWAQSECISYQVLSEQSRSINYVVNDESVGCDRDLNLNGWYRFMGMAGDRMIDYPVSQSYGRYPYRCGTHAVGWLSSSHPTVGDGRVQRTVCFTWLGNACHWSTSIMVTNCGGFFVYHLTGTPQCYLKFCGTGTSSLPSKYSNKDEFFAVISLKRLSKIRNASLNEFKVFKKLNMRENFIKSLDRRAGNKLMRMLWPILCYLCY